MVGEHGRSELERELAYVLAAAAPIADFQLSRWFGNIWGFPKIRGYLFGGPNNQDYSILGSILGSPYFGKLPYGPL